MIKEKEGGRLRLIIALLTVFFTLALIGCGSSGSGSATTTSAGTGEVIFETRYIATQDGGLMPFSLYYPATGINNLSPGVMLVGGMQADVMTMPEREWKAKDLAKAGYTAIYPQLDCHTVGIQATDGTWTGEMWYSGWEKTINDAMNFFRQEGFTKVILTGSSLGGVRISQYVAQTKDPLVKALIYFSPTKDMVAYMQRSLGGDAVYNPQLALAQAHAGETPAYPMFFGGWFQYSADAFLSLYSGETPKHETLMPQISIPCMMLWGQADPGYGAGDRYFGDHAFLNGLWWMQQLKAAHATHDVDIFTYPLADHSSTRPEDQVLEMTDVKAWLKSRNLAPVAAPLQANNAVVARGSLIKHITVAAPAGWSNYYGTTLPVLVRYPVAKVSELTEDINVVAARNKKNPAVIILHDLSDNAYAAKGAPMWASEALAEEGYTTFVPQLPRNITAANKHMKYG